MNKVMSFKQDRNSVVVEKRGNLCEGDEGAGQTRPDVGPHHHRDRHRYRRDQSSSHSWCRPKLPLEAIEPHDDEHFTLQPQF